MPSRRGTGEDYRDIAHPINSDTRNRLQAMILEAYDKTVKAKA